MKPEAKQLREKFARTEKEFTDAQRELERYVTSCAHQFGETKYDPIHHRAYDVPGDEPGTMGSDWRPGVHVPARTEDRWKRECGDCGLVQYTSRTEQEVTRKPKW